MTSNTASGSTSPAGRCLTCGEHVPFGRGLVTGVGVAHLSDRECAAVLRYLDEPCALTPKAPAWASALLEPEETFDRWQLLA